MPTRHETEPGSPPPATDDRGAPNGVHADQRAAGGSVEQPVVSAPGDAGSPEGFEAEAPAPRRKGLTIGAVCKALSQEFPDVSISKIRYLEDQKLLTPKRTPGGYRLYSHADVARLRTILRLQRDEYMPLRVIRQALASGRVDTDMPPAARGEQQQPAGPQPASARTARSTLSVREAGTLQPLEQVLDETGADLSLITELREFQIVTGTSRGGVPHFDDTEREIIRVAVELRRFGVHARNLRLVKNSAGTAAQLLQQILGPGLRSRNPDRRREAVEALDNLAAVASHLQHLLLVRDLRRVANP